MTSKQAPIKMTNKFDQLNGSSIVSREPDLVESPTNKGKDTMPYLDGDKNFETGLIGKKFMLFPS